MSNIAHYYSAVLKKNSVSQKVSFKYKKLYYYILYLWNIMQSNICAHGFQKRVLNGPSFMLGKVYNPSAVSSNRFDKA